jgi:hypothetical protein
MRREIFVLVLLLVLLLLLLLFRHYRWGRMKGWVVVIMFDYKKI